MRHRFHTTLIVTLSLLVLMTTLTLTPREATAAPATPASRSKGLMLRLGFGVDHCDDDWCDNTDPLVFLRGSVLYRFMPYLAAGLHMGFLFQDPDYDEFWFNDTDVDTLWTYILGAEARGILPFKQVDFWMGIVMGYSRWMVDGDWGGDEFDAWMNGFVFGWGFGADYYLFPSIALGLTFYLYKPIYDKLCYESDRHDDDCDELTSRQEDNIGVWWSFGFTFTYHLPM